MTSLDFSLRLSDPIQSELRKNTGWIKWIYVSCSLRSRAQHFYVGLYKWQDVDLKTFSESFILKVSKLQAT